MKFNVKLFLTFTIVSGLYDAKKQSKALTDASVK